MNGLVSFLLFAGLFFVMMRFGCGAHVGHGGHAGHGGESGDGEHAGHDVPRDRGGAGSASNVDPVCGMPVGSGTGYAKTYRGVEYHFCSRDCLDKFDASPEQYAGRTAPTHGGHAS